MSYSIFLLQSARNVFVSTFSGASYFIKLVPVRARDTAVSHKCYSIKIKVKSSQLLCMSLERMTQKYLSMAIFVNALVSAVVY